jgi:hypothetical protein
MYDALGVCLLSSLFCSSTEALETLHDQTQFYNSHIIHHYQRRVTRVSNVLSSCVIPVEGHQSAVTASLLS